MYAAVLVGLLHDEKEPTEWRGLHLGAEREVNCEHICRVFIDEKIFSGMGNGRETVETNGCHDVLRYKTAFVTSLDVNTVFDVAKTLCGISKF